jgi:hypothetical protein
MHPSLPGRALALAALLSGALAGAAHAQDPVDACPAPTVVAQDPAGDQALAFGAATPIPAPANLDITTVALQPTLDLEAARVTITVPHLDKTVPPTSTGLAWYLTYTVEGADRFVAAKLAPDGTLTYDQGTNGQSYTTEGSTTGSFNPGENGTITIDLPDGYWGEPLTGIAAYSYEQVGVTIPAVGSAALLPNADEATAADYTVPDCQVPAA